LRVLDLKSIPKEVYAGGGGYYWYSIHGIIVSTATCGKREGMARGLDLNLCSFVVTGGLATPFPFSHGTVIL